MKDTVLHRIKKNIDKSPFPITEFHEQNGTITFEIAENGLISDYFNDILAFCDGRVISFKTWFDNSNDCTYIQVQIGNDFGYYQHYDGWNYLNGKYSMMWSVEDVRYQIDEWRDLGYIPKDFEISNEKIRRIIADSLDNEYLVEIVTNSIHDYLMSEIEEE